MENNSNVRMIYKALDEKKAENIKILYIGDVSIIADYFIVATGNNQSQIDALTDSVEKTATEAGMELKSIEGIKNSQWILMDYGDIIIHILSKEGRDYYNLEHIWGDCPEITVS